MQSSVAVDDHAKTASSGPPRDLVDSPMVKVPVFLIRMLVLGLVGALSYHLLQRGPFVAKSQQRAWTGVLAASSLVLALKIFHWFLTDPDYLRDPVSVMAGSRVATVALGVMVIPAFVTGAVWGIILFCIPFCVALTIAEVLPWSGCGIPLLMITHLAMMLWGIYGLIWGSG